MKASEVREKIFAIFCLTAIAIVSLIKLDDPENIIINIIVAVAALINANLGKRRTDDGNK